MNHTADNGRAREIPPEYRETVAMLALAWRPTIDPKSSMGTRLRYLRSYQKTHQALSREIDRHLLRRLEALAKETAKALIRLDEEAARD